MKSVQRRTIVASLISIFFGARRSRADTTLTDTVLDVPSWQPSPTFTFRKTVRLGGHGVPLEEFPASRVRELVLSRDSSSFGEIVEIFRRYLAYPLDPAGALLRLPEYALELLTSLEFPPEEGSERLAAELLELYWAAAFRDVSFNQLREAPESRQAFLELQEAGLYSDKAYRSSRLFDPSWSDGGDGYLSSFLVADVPRWPHQSQQRYPSFNEGEDFCRTADEAIRALSGEVPTAKPRELKGQLNYIVTGRRLAALVYQDHPTQIFENVALQLHQLRHRTMRSRGTWGYQERYTPFVFGGLPDLLYRLSTVCKMALDLSWVAKWGIFFYPRPEEVALAAMSSSPEDLLWSVRQVLSSSSLHRGAMIGPLSQAYPEGAPVHPSYPAAHAVVAGAAVTVLKAFVRSSGSLPSEFVSNEGRLASQQEFSTSIDGELNKLAWNMSFGRCFAGVHFRSDCVAGLQLGENLALRYLIDEKSRFPVNVRMHIRRFDGTSVSI